MKPTKLSKMKKQIVEDQDLLIRQDPTKSRKKSPKQKWLQEGKE